MNTQTHLSQLESKRALAKLQDAEDSTRPSVYEFTDYRLFLSTWLEWKKSQTPHYSGAMFAKKAGFSAHTLLGMVIRGDRNLSYDTLRAFIRGLALRGRESLYFEKLVLLNQATHPQDKAEFLEQLASLSTQGQGSLLLQQLHQYSSYIRHWYVVAIREMVTLPDFDADPQWICHALKNKITRKQAQEAWKILNDLNLIEEISETPGKYRILQPAVDIDPGMVDEAIRNYHEEYLERARSAIHEETLQERELSSLTLTVTESGLKRLKDKINQFRKDLNIEFTHELESIQKPANNIPMHIVAVNTQVLVLTSPQGQRTRGKE